MVRLEGMSIGKLHRTKKTSSIRFMFILPERLSLDSSVLADQSVGTASCIEAGAQQRALLAAVVYYKAAYELEVAAE